MIRSKLQAGYGRWLISVGLAIVAFCGIYFAWDKLQQLQVNSLEAAQKVAFVAAAFSVTAYNLRTRVIDLVLKVAGTPSRITQLCSIAKSCSCKLTNLVVLFTITALLMGAGGFIPLGASISRIYAGTTSALFILSVVQFVYVLFAFERLERFMLDDAEERAKQIEVSRLLNPR